MVKLKQRLVAISAVTIMCLISVTYVTYNQIQSHSTEVVVKSSVDVDLQTKMRMRLLEKDKLRPMRRKLNKKAKTSSNSSVYDSDRAVEVKMNDAEYEDFLKNRNLLIRNWNSFNSKTLPSKFSISEMPSFSGPCSESVLRQETGKKREKFPDLLHLLENNPLTDSKRLRITLQEVHGIVDVKNFSHLDLFHIGISDMDLYPENDSNVEELLKDMATLPIVHVEEKQGGTQLKLIVTFQDGSQALFKPMRFDRAKETEPNHFYFVDFERHTSEITAFHLDRILGFRRCPPVVGRKVNITYEIYAVAEDELIETFFISPADNICFHGSCSYYCDTSHAICGHPDVIEGSLAAFLPPDGLSGRKSWKNPWKRSYHKRKKANWEVNPNYCESVRRKTTYKNPKRLADLIDSAILDFLIGNMDRHHYETFKVFGNDSFIIHLDHGRGFGRPNHDEISILAPLYQCCFVNFSTFRRLIELQHGPSKLSSLVQCSLSKDPLFPILLEKHLKSLDRRLEIVLHMIKDCLQNHESRHVLYKESDF